MNNKKAILHRLSEQELTENLSHIDLRQRQLVTPQDANYAGISLCTVLFETLKYHGAVVPHSHSVCEIICITKGDVKAYLNGEWLRLSAGDTMVVPAGSIHSVVNINKNIDSEQISIFIPEMSQHIENSFFDTIMADHPAVDEAF